MSNETHEDKLIRLDTLNELLAYPNTLPIQKYNQYAHDKGELLREFGLTPKRKLNQTAPKHFNKKLLPLFLIGILAVSFIAFSVISYNSQLPNNSQPHHYIVSTGTEINPIISGQSNEGSTVSQGGEK